MIGREARAVSTVPVAALLEMDEVQLDNLGISRTNRRRVLACAELARRYQPMSKPPRAVTTAGDAVAHLGDIRGLEHEAVALLMLDSQLHVIGVEIIARGGLATAAVSPVDIFRPAVRAGASALVIAHNHPAGSVVPSQKDLEFTRAMMAAGAALDIDVLDHIIVAARGFQSLRKLQLL